MGSTSWPPRSRAPGETAREPGKRVNRDVVLVAGRDPLDEPGAGHSSYVRAHARALLRLGFTPHLFCAGRDDATVATDYGVIHRRAPRRRPVARLLAGLYAPRPAVAVAR